MTDWIGRRVLVTGGASFIGSHLVEGLVARGADVRVVDNLSSGRREYLAGLLDAGRIGFVEGDLAGPGVAERAVEGRDIVFHLAAVHGGRGFVDRRQADCGTNFLIDGLLFRAATVAGVGKVIYASSACVYPVRRADPARPLREEDAGPPYDPDNLYGWAKLAGERMLDALHRERGMGAAVCRYSTVYGERAPENLAVTAFVARALLGEDPFEVWGDGEQVRDWIHVDDVVDGTIRAAERIDDAAPVNLGGERGIRVADAVRTVLVLAGREGTAVRFRPEMPTGPSVRISDIARARERLDWTPRVPFEEGLRRTVDWYRAHRASRMTSERLAAALDARGSGADA